MKKRLLSLLSFCFVLSSFANQCCITGPDGQARLTVFLNDGRLWYQVDYAGNKLLEPSPLGLVANTGDYSRNLTWVGVDSSRIDQHYSLRTCKTSAVHYVAKELKVKVQNQHRQSIYVCFRLSNNDLALRYELPKEGETGSIRILKEITGFDFPTGTTTFLTPQSHAMIGWKRSKPSYEEEYQADAPMSQASLYGHGYTFPALFRIGDKGWVLLSETNVDSRYCGSRLSEMSGDGLYSIAFPMMEENNGNGTVEPAFALPGHTPWRTITVGNSLQPIVETTAPWDNSLPRYETRHDYRYGRSTWSWILWQDNSINYQDQLAFIDLAHAMGYEYALVDAGWDKNIGKDGIEQLVRYARDKQVELFLWYSSSGWWNDIVQSPTDIMCHPIERKQYMRWMQEIGIKGIKVDFFGGDKQETMALYEAILSDADDHGLMVIFHGCTLPRGWERMYPNYVGSEAVLASENMVFGQHACDMAAFNATLHPFIRNAVGCMEFGGTFLSRRLSKGNTQGSVRRTTDCAELATAVLFQNPIQNFALAPENLKPIEDNGANPLCLEFMRRMPTTWDETRFIDGYPGQYVVLARRHQQTWYIAGINATKDPLKLTIDLPMLAKGETVALYSDHPKNHETILTETKLRKSSISLTLPSNGGFVAIK